MGSQKSRIQHFHFGSQYCVGQKGLSYSGQQQPNISMVQDNKSLLLFTTGLLHVLWLLPHVLSMILFVVQSVSHVQLFVSLRTTTCQASLSLTISWSLPRFMAIESVMLSTHLILCCPLVLLPSIFPSIRVFSNESGLLIRWTKYWSFSISPSIEYSGLISFRIDWFDLLAVQGTLKSLFQHHNLKAVFRWSAFFMVHLSHPYMSTRRPYL